MKIPNINHISYRNQKDFWDSLQLDILTTSNKVSPEDYHTLIERCFMFSLFFRGCPSYEVTGFQDILGIKGNCYIILLEFTPQRKKVILNNEIDEIKLHYFIKGMLHASNCTVGPLISNRIFILISTENASPDHVHKEDSITLCKKLILALETEYEVKVSAGIGRMQSIHSIYSSFTDAIYSLNNISNRPIVNYLELQNKSGSSTFDYVETERHLIDAIRLRRTEAYDYFGLIMESMKSLSDDAKRNRILELLVLSNHAMKLDDQKEVKSINYAAYFDQFMELEGDQLIDFAFQNFLYITSNVKPQNSIDYTNDIVKATREYLESHYADDISLEHMAEQVNISPQYLSKLIKKTTGFNFIDWLSMLRVKKAKELLNNTNLSVKEVCFMVGYKDPNYFSRIFKKRIGITPSEYVKTSSYLSNKS